jgi:hypothetical protein
MTSRGIPDAGNYVWLEGQQILATLERVSPTSALISWNIPTPAPGAIKAYNGAIVLLSLTEINPSNFPTDTVKYNASTNFSFPADKIGTANVVGAFYNDLTTKNVLVTGLNPDDVYYGSVHLVSNVRTYFTLGSKTYPSEVTTDAFAGSIPNRYEPPTNPTLGELYYDVDNKILFTWNGSQWNPMTDHAPNSGETNPEQGTFVGDIFYNIRDRELKTWNGAIWTSAELPASRTPMFNKLSVGTDLTNDERLNLMDILKKQLGYPMVCTNLTDDHFNIAIDNAIQEARRRLDNAYFRQFVPLVLKPGQQIYYLNDPQIGTDKIVSIIKVHRLNLLGLSTLGDSGVYAQTFLNQLFYPGAQVDLTTIYMIQQYSELFSLIFCGDIAFHWRETTRQLTLFRKMLNRENVLLEVAMEKTEQEMLQDRWLVQWIQQWAESEAMLMQGRIRSKYPSLPGPGGGLSLNGSDLISEAQQLQQDCLRQIMDMEVGNGTGEFGNYSFVIG